MWYGISPAEEKLMMVFMGVAFVLFAIGYIIHIRDYL